MKKFLLGLALTLLASLPCTAQTTHMGGVRLGNDAELIFLKVDLTDAPVFNVNVTDDVILRAAEASGTIRFAAFGSDTALLTFATATSDLTIGGDLVATGGLIGIASDLNLISMAANALTINGSLDVDSLTLDTEIAVGEGGTGATILTDGFVLLGSGTNAITPLNVVTDGAILIGDGATDPTTYNAFSSSTGTLNISAGGTGQTALDDVLGTANEIAVLNGVTSIANGGVDITIGIADSPTLPGDVVIEDDLLVNGGFIGIAADSNLILMAANLLTVDGDFEMTAGSLIYHTSASTLDASGDITASGSYVIIDTFASASSDTCRAILGGVDGQILTLRTATNARNVTFADNGATSGHMRLDGDFTTLSTSDKLMLIWDGNLSYWHEISRSTN